jgi:hypothetical protein
MDIEQAVKDLQDAMVVMAHIEKRQTEHLEELLEFRHITEKSLAKIDQNLAEITDKLNRLIGYVAGYRPPPPPS